ncbi:MAG: hypothetical protein QNL05_05585 [Gammaproteobacteria bacterium]|nr:hypothetical protein [Gammaproteobacteria bacterium]
MDKLLIACLCLTGLLSVNICAAEKSFLTVDELLDNGYILMSGEQVLILMSAKKIKVIDIETDAVFSSRKNKAEDGIERSFDGTRDEKASYFLDPRLMARAPLLDGDIERKVVGDELVSTNGVRTYHYRLYEKQGKIFAVRDIDNGNVFLEIKVK